MIRAKVMAVPGEQLVIPRKADAMIKKAFDEIGIKFAFPTVTQLTNTRSSLRASSFPTSGQPVRRRGLVFGQGDTNTTQTRPACLITQS